MNDLARMYDTYEPYFKDKPQNAISDALKIVLTPKNMTNALIVKRKVGTNPDGTPKYEYGPYLPATTEDGLISYLLNLGLPVPKTSDGRLDWNAINQMTKGEIK
jgi:hypothetical protein